MNNVRIVLPRIRFQRTTQEKKGIIRGEGHREEGQEGGEEEVLQEEDDQR